MHPVGKTLIGLILLGCPLAAYWYEYTGYWNYGFLNSFFIVLKGVVPVVVALAGLFLVWLSLDELRAK